MEDKIHFRYQHSPSDRGIEVILRGFGFDEIDVAKWASHPEYSKFEDAIRKMAIEILEEIG